LNARLPVHVAPPAPVLTGEILAPGDLSIRVVAAPSPRYASRINSRADGAQGEPRQNPPALAQLTDPTVGLAADLIVILGPALASWVMHEYGGVRLYVPRNPRPKCRMARLFGLEGARRLSEALGHGALLIPMGPAARRSTKVPPLGRYFRSGWSTPRIAQRFGIHERTVRRHRRAYRQSRDRQAG
jgi:hypothetical protein